MGRSGVPRWRGGGLMARRFGVRVCCGVYIGGRVMRSRGCALRCGLRGGRGGPAARPAMFDVRGFLLWFDFLVLVLLVVALLGLLECVRIACAKVIARIEVNMAKNPSISQLLNSQTASNSPRRQVDHRPSGIWLFWPSFKTNALRFVLA